MKSDINIFSAVSSSQLSWMKDLRVPSKARRHSQEIPTATNLRSALRRGHPRQQPLPLRVTKVDATALTASRLHVRHSRHIPTATDLQLALQAENRHTAQQLLPLTTTEDDATASTACRLHLRHSRHIPAATDLQLALHAENRRSIRQALRAAEVRATASSASRWCMRHVPDGRSALVAGPTRHANTLTHVPTARSSQPSPPARHSVARCLRSTLPVIHVNNGPLIVRLAYREATRVSTHSREVASEVKEHEDLLQTAVAALYALRAIWPDDMHASRSPYLASTSLFAGGFPSEEAIEDPFT